MCFKASLNYVFFLIVTKFETLLLINLGDRYAVRRISSRKQFC